MQILESYDQMLGKATYVFSGRTKHHVACAGFSKDALECPRRVGLAHPHGHLILSRLLLPSQLRLRARIALEMSDKRQVFAK